MSAFYQRMKTNVADKLLGQFSQGSVFLVRQEATPGAKPWDDPVITEVKYPVNVAARGVSNEYVDGVTILASDIQLTTTVPDVVPVAGDIIEIDGKNYSLVQPFPIPAAGFTVAYKLVVRA